VRDLPSLAPLWHWRWSDRNGIWPAKTVVSTLEKKRRPLKQKPSEKINKFQSITHDRHLLVMRFRWRKVASSCCCGLCSGNIRRNSVIRASSRLHWSMRPLYNDAWSYQHTNISIRYMHSDWKLLVNLQILAELESAQQCSDLLTNFYFLSNP